MDFWKSVRSWLTRLRADNGRIDRRTEIYIYAVSETLFSGVLSGQSFRSTDDNAGRQRYRQQPLAGTQIELIRTSRG